MTSAEPPDEVRRRCLTADSARSELQRPTSGDTRLADEKLRGARARRSARARDEDDGVTIVDRRCAMVSVVRSRRFARARLNEFFRLESSAEVASSRSMRGLLDHAARARAIATRCFSPPESFRPRARTGVSSRRAGSRRSRGSAPECSRNDLSLVVARARPN